MSSIKITLFVLFLGNKCYYKLEGQVIYCGY
nr:MAG TPA: hypothetical protein [Caudoviricetes sp.]